MRNTQAVPNNACGSQNLCRWRDPRPPAPPTLHTVRLLKIFVNNPVYLYIYMRGSASRKDDANSLFWLETKASKKASKMKLEGGILQSPKITDYPSKRPHPYLPRLHPLLRCYYRRRLFLFRLVTVLQTRRLAQATRDLKQSGRRRIRRLRLKNEFLPSIKISKMTAFVYRLLRRHTSTSA